MVTIARNPFYQLRVEETENRLYIIIKGAWDTQQELSHYAGHIKEALAILHPGFSILCDMREMGECSAAVQEIFLNVQRMIMAAGVDQIAEVHTLHNPGSEMAIELAKESKIPLNIFDSPEDALAWLSDLPTQP
ncbi:hypothetical protein [Rufibacter radiotolerans]|nr:hypothetical protein [Rufibacter radiotolerans]